MKPFFKMMLILLLVTLSTNSRSESVTLNANGLENANVTIENTWGANASNDVADDCSHLNEPSEHLSSVFNSFLQKNIIAATSHSDSQRKDSDCLSHKDIRFRSELKMMLPNLTITGENHDKKLLDYSQRFSLNGLDSASTYFIHLIQFKPESTDKNFNTDPRMRFSLYRRWHTKTKQWRKMLELNVVADSVTGIKPDFIKVVSLDVTNVPKNQWFEIEFKDLLFTSDGRINCQLYALKKVNGNIVRTNAIPEFSVVDRATDLWNDEWQNGYIRLKTGVYGDRTIELPAVTAYDSYKGGTIFLSNMIYDLKNR
jgi:hypothetical protein